MPHLLILCTANICRSPMAEGLARALLPDWEVSSSGTLAGDGLPASEFGVQLLAERGIDISRHRSRALTQAMVAGADLVLVMTYRHKDTVKARFPEWAHKIHLLSEMAGPGYDIGDPIGMPIEAYRYTLDELDDLLRRGLARILSQSNQKP